MSLRFISIFFISFLILSCGNLSTSYNAKAVAKTASCKKSDFTAGYLYKITTDSGSFLKVRLEPKDDALVKYKLTNKDKVRINSTDFEGNYVEILLPARLGCNTYECVKLKYFVSYKYLEPVHSSFKCTNKVTTPNTAQSTAAPTTVPLTQGYLWPLKQTKLRKTFLSGVSSFGARRSCIKRDKRKRCITYRLHAAADLRVPYKSKIYAVADGKITTSRYFYLGTAYFAVRESNNRTTRYGETSMTKNRTTKFAYSNRLKRAFRVGDIVHKGEHIAFVGQVYNSKTKYTDNMVHYERFTGALDGRSFRSGGKYQRRADLYNPTKELLKAYKDTFKKSYRH